MSLSFLSKKSWHTAKHNNVEAVWIAEEKKKAEDAKVAELQKQLKEEREAEEAAKAEAEAEAPRPQADQAGQSSARQPACHAQAGGSRLHHFGLSLFRSD